MKKLQVGNIGVVVDAIYVFLASYVLGDVGYYSLAKRANVSLVFICAVCLHRVITPIGMAWEAVDL